MAWVRDIDRWFIDEVLPFRRLHADYARRLTGNGEDGEDVVQDAYARLFALADWRRVANPHAFTMRIIHNVAVERFRGADVVRLDRSVTLDMLDPVDEAATPEHVAMERAELRHVARQIELLPERCREAIKLRRFEGLPPAQVAERMEISVSTVEKHLVKGLRLLMEKLAAPDRGTGGQSSEWVRKRHGTN